MINLTTLDVNSIIHDLALLFIALGTISTGIFQFISQRHTKNASIQATTAAVKATEAAVQATAAVEQSTDNSLKIAEVHKQVNGAMLVATQSGADSAKALADAIPSLVNIAAAEKAKIINENLIAGRTEANKP